VTRNLNDFMYVKISPFSRNDNIASLKLSNCSYVAPLPCVPIAHRRHRIKDAISPRDIT